MKLSDKKIASLYAEARRVAGVCFVPFHNFPGEPEINSLACALITAGLVKPTGKAPRVDRGGSDAEQDELLGRLYGDER